MDGRDQPGDDAPLHMAFISRRGRVWAICDPDGPPVSRHTLRRDDVTCEACRTGWDRRLAAQPAPTRPSTPWD
jgi:hypothetical protein